MCVALDKELLVAGFINHRNDDPKQFKIDDVLSFIGVLWNSGCGPIRPNFTVNELKDYLASCAPIICESNGSYSINFHAVNPNHDIKKAFKDTDNAKKIELLNCLHANINIPRTLLCAIGYGFLCHNI